jgi:hypothetical protein
MKKRLLFCLVVLGAALTVQAMINSMMAAGRGKVLLGHHTEDHGDDGVLVFELSLRDDENGVTGSLLAAAEGVDHGNDFPDMIIRIPSIEWASFSGRTAHFGGNGFVIFDEAIVFGWVKDNEGTLHRDEFFVVALSPFGEMIWAGGGELSSGFAYVGPAH